MVLLDLGLRKIYYVFIEGRNYFEKSKYKCKIIVVYLVSEGN